MFDLENIYWLILIYIKFLFDQVFKKIQSFFDHVSAIQILKEKATEVCVI
jgi:hypothetical protein